MAYLSSLRVLYLYDITGWCSGCTLHTGVGHHLIDGWSGELLLVHARVGHLGPGLSLDHGLRGPGGHWLGLRVSAQRSHDGCSDGCRRGVVLQDRLSEDSSLNASHTCNFVAITTFCQPNLPFSLMLSSVLGGHSSHSGALCEEKSALFYITLSNKKQGMFY